MVVALLKAPYPPIPVRVKFKNEKLQHIVFWLDFNRNRMYSFLKVWQALMILHLTIAPVFSATSLQSRLILPHQRHRNRRRFFAHPVHAAATISDGLSGFRLRS